jgi:hypothetical protein
MLNWLDSHAGAVQALSSVVTLMLTATLAYLTARYVRLTQTIADSSLEQAKTLRESLLDARARNQESLNALARRLKKSLQVLAEPGPNFKQLHTFSLISPDDVTRLEVAAQEHGAGVQKMAADAATGLRYILGLNKRAADTSLIMGWAPTKQDVADYVRARSDTIGALSQIEGSTRKP